MYKYEDKAVFCNDVKHKSKGLFCEICNPEAVESALNPVPASVRNSQFGCRNCLWASCECQKGSGYKPNDKGECQGYTYYD